MRAVRSLAVFLCLTFLLAATRPAEAGLPADLNAGYVRPRVVIPKLDAPAELHTDLDKAPWSQAAKLTGNFDWRRIRTADVPVWTYLFYDAEAIYVACANKKVYRVSTDGKPQASYTMKGLPLSRFARAGNQLIAADVSGHVAALHTGK